MGAEEEGRGMNLFLRLREWFMRRFYQFMRRGAKKDLAYVEYRLFRLREALHDYSIDLDEYVARISDFQTEKQAAQADFDRWDRALQGI